MRRKSSNPHARVRDQFRLATCIPLLILFIEGCSLTVPATFDSARHPSPAVSERAGAEEVWRALGHSIESRTIGTTTQLAQYVVILARNGELTDQDVAAFDAAFPRIATESRALTDTDVNTLTGLRSNKSE